MTKELTTEQTIDSTAEASAPGGEIVIRAQTVTGTLDAAESLFEETMKKNTEKKKRMEEERKKANQSVTRSYGLKDKK